MAQSIFIGGLHMNRSRDYYRKMRAKHIKRKKRITSHYWSSKSGYPYYSDDGRYSKNKIHCSCPLCKEKAYYGKHKKTIQERRYEPLDQIINNL